MLQSVRKGTGETVGRFIPPPVLYSVGWVLLIFKLTIKVDITDKYKEGNTKQSEETRKKWEMDY